MSHTGVYGTGSRRAARSNGASGGDTRESLSSGSMAYISGKQAFLQILRQEGVSVMFGNPGTTELPFMDGLAREPGIHYVLALQEAVAIAMADGYAQASGGLAAVNVHVSPVSATRWACSTTRRNRARRCSSPRVSTTSPSTSPSRSYGPIFRRSPGPS